MAEIKLASHEIFEKDVLESGAYRYISSRLSCQIINRRMSEGLYYLDQLKGERLVSWFNQSGSHLEQQKFIGLAPIFCPDIFAKILKDEIGKKQLL